MAPESQTRELTQIYIYLLMFITVTYYHYQITIYMVVHSKDLV